MLLFLDQLSLVQIREYFDGMVDSKSLQLMINYYLSTTIFKFEFRKRFKIPLNSVSLISLKYSKNKEMLYITIMT